ncbi:MAG TPA: hypothetical protein VKV17_13975 [Bryobacteraceae bacterium]|nr:hypothetical protein [Bryobacteraceae bacterium]
MQAMRQLALLAAALPLFAQFADTLAPSPENPAIGYFNYLAHPWRDPITLLSQKLRSGTVHLRYEERAGYLRSLLASLNVPVESQLAVFSKTSLQSARIEPRNPRTIFFNDEVAVAWVRGGFIEVASADPEQGVVFYTLEQRPAANPELLRRDDCLSCHRSDASLGVPGMVIRSRYPAPDGMPRLILGGFETDHRSPFEERWGGWYVTGAIAGARHMGNAFVTDEDHPEAMSSETLLSLATKFDTTAYLSPYSDIAALLVFNHQMHMVNLLTRFGWEVRAHAGGEHGGLDALLRDGAKEVVDYLLFVDEVPLPGPVRVSNGFAESFAARGPRDAEGRSLRQLDLETRLLRYPCSYMIYSPVFASLPEPALAAIYRRMWQVLSGEEKDRRYARLTAADRGAIVEILRATKKGLPPYFRPL